MIVWLGKDYIEEEIIVIGIIEIEIVGIIITNKEVINKVEIEIEIIQEHLIDNQEIMISNCNKTKKEYPIPKIQILTNNDLEISLTNHIINLII
jgi:hypothetical protein